MIDPIFFLGLSIFLVAGSLTAVLIVLIPAVQELARAGRSAEKLFDTLRRELPPTLEAIRLTGLEISDLTDDVSEGVKNAGQVAKQVDQGLDGVKSQAQKVQATTRNVLTGLQAAWKTFTRNSASTARRSASRLPAAGRPRREMSSEAEWLTPSGLDYGEAEEPIENYQPPDMSPRRSSRLEMPSDLVDD